MGSHRISLVAAFAVVLVYALTVLHRRWTQYRFARAHGCQPPVRLPHKFLLFGIDGILETIRVVREHRYLEHSVARFDTHGHTFAAQNLQSYTIVTREPQNVKTILALRFSDYGLGDRIDYFGPLLGHGIFTSDGDAWAQSRALIRPNFVRDQVADLDAFESLMPDLLALIPAGDATVDLQELFFSYTIDSATEFLFDHGVQSLKKRRAGGRDADFEDDFASAFNYAQHAVSNSFILGSLRVFFRDPRAKAAYRVCHAFVDQFVDRALAVRNTTTTSGDEKEGKKRYRFLDSLAQQTGDRRRLRDELMNVLLAGRDTTASLLSNLFFMLAKHPPVWARLRQEIAFLEGRPPTYEQLRNLTYVKYCLNESLRIHPVVPENGRTALVDTVLPLGGGPHGQSPLFVPRGTVVVYNPYAMHRRTDFFGPDAEHFRPDRWAQLRPGWEYLPFNGGPRICIGQQYALTEAAYVTVRLAQRFAVLESRDPGPWVENVALTVVSRNGVRVCLRE